MKLVCTTVCPKGGACYPDCDCVPGEGFWEARKKRNPMHPRAIVGPPGTPPHRNPRRSGRTKLRASRRRVRPGRATRPVAPRYEEHCPGYPKTGGVCSTDQAAWGCKTHWRAGKTVCCCPKILVNNPVSRRSTARLRRRGAPSKPALECIEGDVMKCFDLSEKEGGGEYCFCQDPQTNITYPPREKWGRPTDPSITARGPRRSTRRRGRRLRAARNPRAHAYRRGYVTINPACHEDGVVTVQNPRGVRARATRGAGGLAARPSTPRRPIYDHCQRVCSGFGATTDYKYAYCMRGCIEMGHKKENGGLRALSLTSTRPRRMNPACHEDGVAPVSVGACFPKFDPLEMYGVARQPPTVMNPGWTPMPTLPSLDARTGMPTLKGRSRRIPGLGRGAWA